MNTGLSAGLPELTSLSLRNANTIAEKGVEVSQALLSPDLERQRQEHFRPTYGLFGLSRFGRNLPVLTMDELGEPGFVVNVVDGQLIKGFNEQDCLYVDATYGPSGIEKLKLVSSLQRGFNIEVPGDLDSVLYLMSQPSFKYAFLTLTIHGYYVKKGSMAQLDLDAPALVSDAENSAPTTGLGVLVQAIALRRKNGIDPFVVLSCDNADVNPGEVLAQYAEKVWPRSKDLADYIREEVPAPITMVDSVTAGHTKDLERRLTMMGIRDPYANAHEPFRVGIGEWLDRWPDKLKPELPNWSFVSPEIAEDIRLAKRIIVNATHFAISLIGATSGTKFVHEVTGIDEARTFLKILIEIYRDTLIAEKKELGAYGDADPLERFDIPLFDQVARVGRNPQVKVDKYIISRMLAARDHGQEIQPFIQLIALWIRWNPSDVHPLPYRIAFDPDDRDVARMTEKCRDLIRAVGTNDLEWFKQVFGKTRDLSRVSSFAAESSYEGLKRLMEDGPIASLAPQH